MSAQFPLADLVVRIVGDMSQFSREMVRAESLLKKKASAFTQLEAQGTAVMSSLGKAAAGFGSVMAVSFTAAMGTLAAMVGALTAFSIWSTKVAVGADELRNRFKVTFGQEAQRSQKSLSDFADDVGRSRLELMDMAATLQNVFTAMGFGISASADLSVTIAKLGTDIASFHDIADSDAVDRLSSALVGNHEALRSLGIVVTETAVKQELLNMGFKGGFDAASDQQKILARLNIILRATSLMQNDAARTADSAANQFKGLWGVIKDLADLWGQSLIPALKVFLGAFRDLALSARDNAASLKQFGAMLAGWATTIVEIFGELGFVLANYDLAWQSLALTVQAAIEPIHVAIANFAVTAFAAIEWLGANWQIVWKNTLENMAMIFYNFSVATMKNIKGLFDFITSGGKEFEVDTRGWTAAMDDVTKGTTEFTAPEINKTDWDAKFKELEDEFAKRRGELAKKKEGFDPFSPPDLQSLFDSVTGNVKAEIKVSMADSVSFWRENLLAAFKDTEQSKQTKLQEQIAANQQKQMDADKQNAQETIRALGFVGGGFY